MSEREIITFNFKLWAWLMFVLACTQPSGTLSRALDRDAYTIYYNNKPPNVAGHFNYEFQTSNGITVKSAGNEFGFSGVVQYISLEGIPITMTYVADADGFHPTGDHIPTTPTHVTKALEYIRTHSQSTETTNKITAKK